MRRCKWYERHKWEVKSVDDIYTPLLSKKYMVFKVCRRCGEFNTTIVSVIKGESIMLQMYFDRALVKTMDDAAEALAQFRRGDATRL